VIELFRLSSGVTYAEDHDARRHEQDRANRAAPALPAWLAPF
jgi:hypothetical protein